MPDSDNQLDLVGEINQKDLELTSSTNKETSQYNPAQIEQKIIDFWKEHKTFEKSITMKSEDNPYRFYDWPPFITWLPHYGHLLSSVMKDVVTRFHTQKGKRIDRVWGWDCHGIYVEQKVQEKNGYTSNKDIEAKGIEGFIEKCYEYTKGVSDQWDWYVDHIGRWVDFKNAYKTMDNSYMESVLWVFKSLWDKWMIYKGKRVSLYSTKLNTPISNYEVALDNSYEDVSDPAITVKFPVNWYTSDIETTHFIHTDDNFINATFAIIRDEKGRLLSIYNAKREMWQFPGGKAENGETIEQSLIREVKEELGVDCVIWTKLGQVKRILNKKPRLVHFFEVTLQWDPVLQEPNHTKLEWTTISSTDANDLWYQYEVDGVIVDDANEIKRFPSLYTFQTVLPVLKSYPETSSAPLNFLAWTTTPRTIAANIALAVNPEMRYMQLFDKNAKEYFILAENLIGKYYKNAEEYIEVYRCRGVEFLWIKYTAPFSYYQNIIGQLTQENKNFTVLPADYVTDEDGTGVVHQAPEFGEEDFQTGLKYGLYQTEMLDEQGNYLINPFVGSAPEREAIWKEYVGTYYRDVNELAMRDMKANGTLIKKESITHSVAMCPRTWVPLIYKAQDARFVNIQAIKWLLAENNEKIFRLPEHLKHGRFLKSMESAPDRNISRTRFWATPMPVWKAEDSDDMIVLWSLEEIYQLDQTGSKIIEKRTENWKAIYRDTLNNKEFDLHRPYIDAVRGLKNNQKYIRVPEVLDPWLESGSMPYAQVHYPFENKEKFEASFPADYVSEYVGQVRAWFFFMHVLATMLSMPYKLVRQEDNTFKLVEDKPALDIPFEKYNSPAFKNVVCTGVLAWNDGRKMSKSLGNYPDPKGTMMALWWDALRMNFATSPIVVWWDTNISEESIREIYKKTILPLWNSYYFFTTYSQIDWFTADPSVSLQKLIQDERLQDFKNPLDTWMLLKTMKLVNTINEQLGLYNLQTSSTALIGFMEDLTNRYIRRSRRRFWESGAWENMGQDKVDAYTVLYTVLTELCLIAAPFMPFITEYIYKKLTWKESVHLEEIVTYDSSMISKYDLQIDAMELTKKIVSLGLSLRWQKKIRVKQPLQKVILSRGVVFSDHDISNTVYHDMIKDELNVKEIVIDSTMEQKVQAICKPNARLLWKKFGKDMQEIISQAKSGAFTLESDGSTIVSGVSWQKWTLQSEEFTIEYEKWDVPFDVAIDGALVIALDDTISEILRLEWDARDLIRYIQEARKEADYNMDARIQLAIKLPQDVEQAKDMPFASDIAELLKQFGEMIASETLSTIVKDINNPDIEKDVSLDMIWSVGYAIKKI